MPSFTSISMLGVTTSGSFGRWYPTLFQPQSSTRIKTMCGLCRVEFLRAASAVNSSSAAATTMRRQSAWSSGMPPWQVGWRAPAHVRCRNKLKVQCGGLHGGILIDKEISLQCRMCHSGQYDHYLGDVGEEPTDAPGVKCREPRLFPCLQSTVVFLFPAGFRNLGQTNKNMGGTSSRQFVYSKRRCNIYTICIIDIAYIIAYIIAVMLYTYIYIFVFVFQLIWRCFTIYPALPTSLHVHSADLLHPVHV